MEEGATGGRAEASQLRLDHSFCFFVPGGGAGGGGGGGGRQIQRTLPLKRGSRLCRLSSADQDFWLV